MMKTWRIIWSNHMKVGGMMHLAKTYRWFQKRLTRYVTILYINRKMELSKPNNVCSETLKHFGMGMMFCYLDMLIFYWNHMYIVKNDVYKPNTIFQKTNSIFFCWLHVVLFHIRNFKNILILSHKTNSMWILVLGFCMVQP
jgi:hypothetical protein